MKVAKKPYKPHSISDVKSVKFLANEEEKKLAKEIGGRQTINSGATIFDKGDVHYLDYCLDMKMTVGKQIIVTEDMLTKMEQDAMDTHKTPAIVLNFSKSKKLRNTKWVLTPMLL